MTTFYISQEGLRSEMIMMRQVSTVACDAQRMVSNAASGLAAIGLGEIGPNILAIHNSLSKQRAKVELLADSLGKIVNRYKEAEAVICNVVRVNYDSIPGGMQPVLHHEGGTSGLDYSRPVFVAGPSEPIEAIVKFLGWNDKAIYGTISLGVNGGTTEYKRFYSYDEENPYERLDGANSEMSNYEGDNLRESYDGHILKEFTSAAKSWDGEKVNYLEGSFSAISLHFNPEVTVSLLGTPITFFSETEIGIGEVGVKYGGEAGWHNQSGEFDPHFYFGVEGGAAALNVKGAVGVSAFGFDIKFGASEDLGGWSNGAHLSYDDGDLNLGFGAFEAQLSLNEHADTIEQIVYAAIPTEPNDWLGVESVDRNLLTNLCVTAADFAR